MPKNLDTGQGKYKTEPGAMDDPGIKRLRSRNKALEEAMGGKPTHNKTGAVRMNYGKGKKRKKQKDGR